jgi:hypothetical protein
LPARAEGCLSDLTLDRLLDGELGDGAEAHAATAHLAACTRCRARRAEIEAVPAQEPDARWLQAHEPDAPREINRKAGRREGDPGSGPRSRVFPPSRLPVQIRAVGALALAAAAALVLYLRAAGGDGAATTRIKGSQLGLELLVRREGGPPGPLLPDERLRAGDVLGFRVRSAKAGFLTIVGVDGAGQVTRYAPQGEAAPAAELAPGQRVLEESVVLDGARGEETGLALLCPARADAERAPAAAAAAVGRAGQAGLAQPLDLPCLQARATFAKEPPR